MNSFHKQILNVNEMKRRLSEMEEQTIALPELSEHSFILFEKHFRKVYIILYFYYIYIYIYIKCS